MIGTVSKSVKKDPKKSHLSSWVSLLSHFLPYHTIELLCNHPMGKYCGVSPKMVWNSRDTLKYAPPNIRLSISAFSSAIEPQKLTQMHSFTNFKTRSRSLLGNGPKVWKKVHKSWGLSRWVGFLSHFLLYYTKECSHTMTKYRVFSSKMVSNSQDTLNYEPSTLRLSISAFISATKPQRLHDCTQSTVCDWDNHIYEIK